MKTTKKDVLKVLNESVSLSHAIEQNVILEQDFDSLAGNLVKLFAIPVVSPSTLSDDQIDKIKKTLGRWFYTRNREMLNDEFLTEIAKLIDIALT